MLLRIVLTTVLVLAHSDISKCSLVSSIVGLEKVLDTEALLISNLDEYILKTEVKLDILRRKLENARFEHSKATVDIERYLTNPITAYSLIRRMFSDWSKWTDYIAKDPAEDVLKRMINLQNDPTYPTAQDLKESNTALLRLQSTYKLEVSDMIAGNLNGVQYDAKMSALDTFEIGMGGFNALDHYASAIWLNATWKLYHPTEENIILGLTQDGIFLAAAENKKAYGDLYGAHEIYRALLKLNPRSMQALTSSQILESTISFKEYMGENLFIELLPKPKTDVVLESEKGCRGEYDNSKNRHLFCKWEQSNHAFLKLAPFKMEVVRTDPLVVVFHDVVSDSEIETLKELATPALKRAIVYHSTQSNGSPVEGRTSKTAWFGDNVDVVKAISRRTMDMTGLSLSQSETIQIMNYGIGGYNFEHLDAFPPPDNEQGYQYLSYHMGNRLSTILFYISDVEQGGATVFPHLNVTLWPKKGSAAFWFNLDTAGEVNLQTLHAACPVLVGSKWVFNKWVRANGEMFNHPCAA